MALNKQVLLKNTSRLPPMPPRGVPGGRPSGGKPHGIGRKRDFTPLPWSNYFDSCEDVVLNDNDSFRVYKKGNEGPVVFFLHGGGHSALSWALLAQQLTGMVNCRVVAMDMRGHGDTHTSHCEDLSADTLASDIGAVIGKMYPNNDCPPIILVGHSMGGAIAIHTAVKFLVPSLLGLVVIDVVEGTAMDALQSMQSFLRGRPKQFKSLEYAIEWAVKTGQIRNVESARVSMLGQVKPCVQSQNPTEVNTPVPSMSMDGVITEEGESHETLPQSSTQAAASSSSQESHTPYTWRIDLGKTEQYWAGWFRGMSNLFLSCNVPKMLILAGVDRLDKDLTIGQMQGKFQMQVLPQCGHAVHEDQPQKVADALATFITRNKFAEAIGGFEQPFPCC
ncbi:protein phosphatase methylesterase 1-like [Lytechinus variegatus]|uniref:protein phosphatase methylesterase 1-like n=1 Tax=Lytechinus variegatus TaxID=7654 RepID=UPI001BB29975|nr:protein phosphatase methylesterase 1-like [Lytechinus variegatus]